MHEGTSYADKLKDPRWQRIRLRVFERDGWRCTKCGREDLELHTHHSEYLGPDPWDTPLDRLTTLCDECHKETHNLKVQVHEADETKPISSDLFLMLIIAINRDLFPRVLLCGVKRDDLDDPEARALYEVVDEYFRAGEAGLVSLLARIDDASLREMVVRKAASGEFDVNPERIVADSLLRIRQRRLRRDREAVQARLRRLEGERADPAVVRELLAEKQSMDEELARVMFTAYPSSDFWEGEKPAS